LQKGRSQLYLKRLEIQGFKSFADKTKLEFKPGITLVVGPNGSGKSNIADAIRWVLGEQSVKSLRGGKMEDVIFAGSEQRRPLGMAEVSLTVDNSSGLFPLEYNEITVTRRLYRSGESDYLINRVPCRLRDIHNLFMDTGVGREGFSIIGQGKVDEVLSVKPEVRRGLLEEAAGIVKYRYKKREAVQKLAETENSLVRLSDIIGELTRQEEPLAEQAKKATQYKSKKTELDSLEIGLIIAENEHCRNRLEKVEGKLERLELEIEETKTNYHQMQSSEEEYKLELQQKDEELALYREKIYQENLTLEKNESEKKLIRERMASLAVQTEQLEQEREQLHQEEKLLQQELVTHRSQEDLLLKELAEGQEKLCHYEELLAEENEKEAKVKAELEELKNYHFELLQKGAQVHNEITGLKQRIASLQKQKEQITMREGQMKEEREQVLEKLSFFEKEAEENVLALLNLEKELVIKDRQYLQKREQLQKQQQQNLTCQQERNDLCSRRQLLEEMEKEGQGYAYGVRGVLQLQANKQLEGIVGPVAQIIKVPSAYEKAVEVVLGGSLQHIVTENEEVARQAIAWLKQQKRGRVTFLPLDTVKGQVKRGLVPTGEGVIGCLSELIAYEDRYKGIIEYLLGRVWLVKNLAIAVQKGRETSFRWRLVTLDGETVNPGGSLTGGSIKPNSNSLLSRKRKILELTKKIKEREIVLAQGQKKEAELEIATKEAHHQWEEIKEKMQKLRLREVEVSSVLERWRADKGRQELELEGLQLEIKQTGNEAESLLTQVVRFEQEQKMLEEKTTVCLIKIEELQQKMEKRQAEKLQKNEALTQLRIEVATGEAKLAAYRKEENYYLSRLGQLTQLWEEKVAEKQKIKEKKTELTTSFLAVEESIAHSLQLSQEWEGKLQEMRQVKVNVQEQIGVFAEKIKKYTNLLRRKEEKKHQLQLQQSKLDTAWEAAKRRLQEQYNLTVEEGREKGTVLASRQKSLERIVELKVEINKLGEVNLGAIEEYARLKERLDFLHLQVQDLCEAKKRLEVVIAEMDRIMARKFKETYIQVDQAFQEVFVQLFGGGKAELVLCEPESLLETGVEIIAQPPGKKTQNLSLLSGGERALTAIALLMAMLKVRPSPFCVLDEIESNLDETNISRFTDLLTRFAEETQFIVISHRKGTMEVGHVLYGVTMEETGVSRLVSVKLEDAQKEAS
jgi:chromosome segregation protein